MKKIDFCLAAKFSLVQGIKHLLSNKVFIGLECKMKSFNSRGKKVFIGSSYRFTHASFSSYLRSGSIFVLRFQYVLGNFPLIV